MINYEETIINNIILDIERVVPVEELGELRNRIGAELHKYVITERNYDVAVVEGNTNEYYLKLFIAAKRIEGKSEGTIERYRFVVCKLFDYIDKPISDMTTNDIRYFLATYKRGNTNTTMDGMRRCLSTFFNWLEAEDYIIKSPVRKLSKIKLDTVKEDPYTSAEMEALLIHTESIRDKAILTMLYTTGVRVSELSSINVNDIDYRNNTVHILKGKGGKDRFVPIESKTMYYLEEYLKWRDSHNINGVALFISKRNRNARLKAAGIRAMINKVSDKADIQHAHPHRYRVTRITDLLRRGMKLEEVQVIAGHEDINTTASYNRCDMSLVNAEFRRKS